MTDGIDNDKTTACVNSVNKIPLISVMEKATILWGIKDNQSRFIYLNDAAMNFCNIPNGFDFEGRLDNELPVPWYEQAPELQAHDRKAEQSRDGAEVIETSYFGRDAILEPWLCSKFPFFNESGDVAGTIFYAKKFSFISVYNFFENLKPSVITLSPPVSTFTERELDIIFYAIQKLSAKEIAYKLCLSPRTVENRLQGIYGKINVNSMSGLVDYCHTVGLNN